MLKHTTCNFSSAIRDARSNLKKIPSIYPTLNPSRLNFKNRDINFNRKKPYDLSEIYRAVDTESFIASTLRKKILLILKDGYSFISKDQENIEYIKKRIAEMEYATDKTFDDLLLEIVSSIIFNHNAFLYKVRNSKATTGLKRKNLQPLAGVYLLPEYQVEIEEDYFHQKDGYVYQTDSLTSKFLELDDMFHYVIDKKPGVHYGTPPLEPVRDDILSLRQIEESLERLIYKLTSPLIHMKVGSEKRPATIDRATSRPETEIYNELMLDMDDTGGITTSERVEIKMIGAESHALRLESPLKHYVNRVLVGLIISEVDLGVGNSTTGGAAEVISNSLKQNVQMYQFRIESMISDTIFNTFLLESERYIGVDFIPKDERVRLKFDVSDLDVKVKQESHMMQEVNAKVITADEYRIATGRPVLTLEQKREMYESEGRGEEQPVKSGLISQNVTESVNQFSDSISDQIPAYLDSISKGNIEYANEILYIDIRDSLSMPDLDIELHQSISALTITLQKYIIKKVPTSNVRNVVNKVLSDIVSKLVLKTST